MKNQLFLLVLCLLGIAEISAQDSRGMERKNWMSYIDDSTPVCQITIPGAHDACTGYMPVYGICVQNLTVDQMFDDGIRCFDVRVGANGLTGQDVEWYRTGLGTYHGFFYLYKTFRGVMDILYEKIRENPSEGVIVMISIEHDTQYFDIKDYGNAKLLIRSYFRSYWGEDVGARFSIIDWGSEEEYNNAKSLWVTNWRPDMTMGELRGKVLFLWGDWIDNQGNFTHMPGIHTGGIPNNAFSTNTWEYPVESGTSTLLTFGQNYYSGPDLEEDPSYKFHSCAVRCSEEFTRECVEHPENHTWCINMLSAFVTMGLSPLCSTIIAKETNSPFSRYLAAHPESYNGLVLCDWFGKTYGMDGLETVNSGGLEIIDALISNNRRHWRSSLRVDKRTPFEIPSNPEK